MDTPVLLFDAAADWEEWLSRQHLTSGAVWLKIAKKDSGRASISYDEALDVALCYGWIDGQKGRFDDLFWLQRFSHRGKASKWSQQNRERVERLIEADRMRPEGLREVERAKMDGRWEAAYAGQASASVPEDLQQALEANPAALSFFEGLDRANRYAILYRVQDAKRPETRARRIETFVAMLARGERIHGSTTSD